MNRILLLAENPAIAASLEGGLTASSIALTHRPDGAEIESLALEAPWLAVLLGTRLGDERKFEICERIRWQDPQLPILFLSRKEGSDGETALDLPEALPVSFKPRELVAWMRRWAPCDVTRAEFQPVDLVGLLRAEIKKQNAADPETAPLDGRSMASLAGELWVSGEPRLVRRLISQAFAKARETGSPKLEVVLDLDDAKEIGVLVRGDRDHQMVRFPRLHIAVRTKAA